MACLLAYVHQLLLEPHVLSCQATHQLVQLTVVLLELLTPLLYLVHLHPLALAALVGTLPIPLHACLHLIDQGFMHVSFGSLH